MSITLMRYKDGKSTPIKLSVWDAFKGVPVPKPRLHRCDCCNKLHKPGTKQTEAAASTSTREEKNDKSTKEKLAGAALVNEHNFTAEEDAKIQAMKDENATWAKTAEALGKGRNKDQVRARYKQLQSTEADTQAGENGKDDQAEQTENPAAKLTKAQKKAKAREEGLKRQAEAQAKKDGDKTLGDANTIETKTASGMQLSEKTKPNSESDKQKWIVAASKHFDRTGRRITPDQARKLAESCT